jgi:hypothetical protein
MICKIFILKEIFILNELVRVMRKSPDGGRAFSISTSITTDWSELIGTSVEIGITASLLGIPVLGWFGGLDREGQGSADSAPSIRLRTGRFSVDRGHRRNRRHRNLHFAGNVGTPLDFDTSVASLQRQKTAESTIRSYLQRAGVWSKESPRFGEAR